ncbi:MAG: hypothetical protein WCP39_03700 [Chlamydiota bacterium]
MLRITEGTNDNIARSRETNLNNRIETIGNLFTFILPLVTFGYTLMKNKEFLYGFGRKHLDEALGIASGLGVFLGFLFEKKDKTFCQGLGACVSVVGTAAALSSLSKTTIAASVVGSLSIFLLKNDDEHITEKICIATLLPTMVVGFKKLWQSAGVVNKIWAASHLALKTGTAIAGTFIFSCAICGMGLLGSEIITRLGKKTCQKLGLLSRAEKDS